LALYGELKEAHNLNDFFSRVKYNTGEVDACIKEIEKLLLKEN
jgi:hypothetical protein